MHGRRRITPLRNRQFILPMNPPDVSTHKLSALTRPPRRARSALLTRLLSRLTLPALALCAVTIVEAAPPELATSGNQIVVKATSTPVRLTGVNIPSLEWSLTGEHLAQSLPNAIIDWQAKIIRLPVEQDNWLSPANGAAYKTVVDGVIANASTAGVYVLLDLHEYGQPTANAATFWTDAATRYKNNPAVIFGLCNEPHGTTWTVWRDGDSNGPGMQGLLNAVRATGANNVVTAGGLDFAYNLSGIIAGYALTEATGGNGIVYETHIYPWKGSWQANVGNIAQVYPVLVGEIGHPGVTSFIGLTFEAHPTWVPRILDFVDTHKLNWTGWSFYPGADPRMIVDWEYVPTEFWGTPAFQRLQSYQNPAAEKIAGGTVIGSTGTKANPTSGVITDVTNGAVSAFNGVYTNYFEGAASTGSWTGLDLVEAKRITKVRFMPRASNGALMVGGVFQGSNSATFATPTTLFTIASAPVDTGGVYTSANVTNTGAFRYVRYVGPTGSYSTVASILFYTGDGGAATTAVDDTIVDNSSTTGVTFSPSAADWPLSTNFGGFYGTNYVHDNNTNKGAKSVRFTPNLPARSRYEVFTRWAANSNRSNSIPVDIEHFGGTSFVTVNQQTNGGVWVSLGIYEFNAGTAGSVIFKTACTTGYVTADAVRFVRLNDFIMDTNSPGVTFTPKVADWPSSTTSSGFYGTYYRHDNNTNKGASFVQYAPTLGYAGNYEVFAWWSANANRANNVPITITHASGSATVTVDQRTNGGQWVSLGVYAFNAGSSGTVSISNTGTSGFVIADGVRFTKQ